MPKKIPMQEPPGRGRLQRKTTYLFEDEADALERTALEERVSEAEILRRAWREFLKHR